MKLKQKWAKETIHDLPEGLRIAVGSERLIHLERKAFLLGFEKFRELAMERFQEDAIVYDFLQKLGEEEVV